MNTARRCPQHIILPEGNDRRVITAAGELLRRNICRLTILGPPEEVLRLATSLQVDISAATLVDPDTSEQLPVGFRHSRWVFGKCIIITSTIVG
jgi:phosphate acetyltransferase